MSESTATKSNVFKEDIMLAKGGTGGVEEADRKTSTGGSVTLTKLDASHIKFRSITGSAEDLVDGGKDVTIQPLNIDAGGTLKIAGTATLSILSSGFVKSSAAGLLSVSSIAAGDLPAAIPATSIANGSISNAEFQYLDGVTSNIQTQLNGLSVNTIIQTVYTQTGTVNSGTTNVPFDNTIPAITEGKEYMSRTITPTSATNLLKIDVVAILSVDTECYVTGALFMVGTTPALAASFIFPAALTVHVMSFTHFVIAGSTSELTFKFRAGGESGITHTLNGVGGVQRMGGVASSSMTITEITV